MSQESICQRPVLGWMQSGPQKTRAEEEVSARNAFSVFSKATFCIGSDRAPFQNNFKRGQNKNGLSTDR